MKKKVDSRIQTLIKNGMQSRERTMLVLVGDRSRYQIVNFHYMLTHGVMKAKPKVLWCYKKNLQFSSHQKKRIKEVKNLQLKGLYDENVDDPFDLFISSTEIRYTYYNESHKVLGNTYQMLILQDFEALTPNVLCRTIETVEGGGLIIFLLRTMTSLKQLHTLVMDVHQRYRTDAFQNVQPRFNERFLLSLSRNRNCIIMDDQLNVLPISEHVNNIAPIDTSETLHIKTQQQLNNLKQSFLNKQIIGQILTQAKTLDQAKVLITLIDVLADKTCKTTVSLTASRGRGKSAAIGLSLAVAIKLGFSNIFVTAPSPQNLKTLFEFVSIGLQMLNYKARQDYEIIYSANADYDRAVLRIDLNKNHTQFIQYVFPNDADKIGHCDLMVIDQAAAIPLPYVKSFFGPHCLFLSSTINGYEGTGRSLSLKLIEQIRHRNMKSTQDTYGFKKFKEVTMNDPIRYAINDEIQRWLNELLLLNATEPVPMKSSGLPHPNDCELYIVNRDTLFSYRSSSQKFLFALMSLFISSHYKNSPNDLQLLSDSPSHLLFVLLGPLKKSQDGKTELPDVLCAIQLALQGNLSQLSVTENAQRGIKPSGDLIPWSIREQFQDTDFPTLAGGRIVRIATHAKVMKMGYGSRALQLLTDFFEGKLLPIQEDVQIANYDFRGEGLKKPLLKKLEEVRPPQLQYLGTSFGFTQVLLKFWRKNGFEPVYVRQTVNDITAEHSGILLKALQNDKNALNVKYYVQDFRKRFSFLLGFQFCKLSVSLGLEILSSPQKDRTATEGQNESKPLARSQMELFISLRDYQRLRSYVRNQVDYHLVIDLLPALARLYFIGGLGTVSLGYTNQGILLGIGLQMKTIEQVCKDLKDLEVRNALPLFQKTLIKFTKIIQQVYEGETVSSLPQTVIVTHDQALPNESNLTDIHAKQETEKIFSNKKRKKISDNLDEEEINNLQIKEGTILTIKRSLDHGKESVNVSRKKVKLSSG